MKIGSFLFVAVAYLLPPLSAHAVGAGGSTFKIENPLGGAGGSIKSIPDLLGKIVEIAMQIGLPLAALAIIYSGFLYVTAGGNQGKVEAAHKTFLWTVVGASIILGAYAIVEVVKSTVTELQ
ncbi:MAG: hypothetical protein COV07_01220 [Candidatus Vogelbacteria bacterium CG10_big_fil_rev_8_21_14_0_10_45_14]|uniref:Conjugal transfer protein TrbC n=1 Tax=Candidatus Vogelbacteria bacterium CG10_big_fil_rev_8_21_14_0_10_45_14 TaxID=1975042 RepID=A0A2H0RKC9_9BACT|nr:MAG: hypothetical protein COV07_01220 [Candidatus Vogelbacteria bacterium CG10_big_fil_rev_8_21_14_0_10_45_14]